MAKNGQKRLSYVIEIFSMSVISMVKSPLPKTVAEIKIGSISSKFCLVSHSVILFVVFLLLFE